MSEPAKKGTRQPQLSMIAGERFIVNSPTKPEARKTPTPVNSPPSENPEAIRATRKIAGARWPAVL
jgi:hypothetical protein